MTVQRIIRELFFVIVLPVAWSFCQVSSFPYVQSFDSVAQPLLPAGWSSSQNRSPGTNDFTTSGTAHSSPNAALSTNATIGQSLTSPVLDFRGQVPDRLLFFTRRSATHAARVVVEASTDFGQTFPFPVGDTLTNTNPNVYVQESFFLPAGLAGESGVQLRWRILPDAGGNTGTFRVDDVTVTSRTARDLALGRLRFEPAIVAEGDTAFAVALVKNVGLQPVSPLRVEFSSDANCDSIPQSAELIATVYDPAVLAPGDSIEVRASVGSFPPGTSCFIARVVDSTDQNPSNNTCAGLLQVGYGGHAVVVNEIMYAPTGTEPEWVELYNNRPDSVCVRDWMVSDNNVTARKLITSSRVMIPPAGYVVLTKDSAALLDIHPSIPSRVINIPAFPTLNNTGDAVVLYDNRSATMDSVTYVPSWGGGSGGKSLERIDSHGPSTVPSNWGTCRDAEHGTPGFRNSLSRKDHDLAADTLLVSPALPVHGDTVIASLMVRNAGLQPAPSFGVQLYLDTNNDSLPEPGELLASIQESATLAPLDSVLCPFPPWRPQQNDPLLMAVVSFPPDEDSSNNQTIVHVRVGYAPGSLVINEIMYGPAGEPEWVEVYNLTTGSLDLKDWKISNRLTTTRYLVASTPMPLSPGGLAVIVRDTAAMVQRYCRLPGVLVQAPTMPTYLFNNSGDAAVIFDNRDIRMDSVRYTPAWGGTDGTSLERVDVLEASGDSANWTSSTDSLKATPCRENSVAALDDDLRVLKCPPLVAPPQVPATFSLTVRNVGRQTAGSFDVAFFDDADHDSMAAPGEMVTRVHVAQPLARGDTLRVSASWPSPAAGCHIMIGSVEYPPDRRPANNVTLFEAKIGYLPRAVVVNEIMYAPFPGEAEYVELFNAGESPVDLTGWKLSDRPGSSGSSNEFSLRSGGRLLQPGEFFVMASDSSLYARFREMDTVQTGLVTVCNQSSLSLNNEGDAVVIRDATRSTIDSVAYLPLWHNPAVADVTGRSLERIRPALASNDPRSWSTCVRNAGGTPGAVNSIFASTLPSSASISCSPNPFSPDGDGREDFSVIHYELPVDVATVSMKIFDVRGRLIRHLVNNEPSGARRDVVWDGHDDDRQKARVGIYVVLVEGLNDRGGSVYSARAVVVLAAKL